MSSFDELIKHFKADIESVKQRDPAAKNTVEIILTYSGLHAVAAYRVSHYFYKKKMFLTARVISQAARFITGIEIHPGAKIGKGLFIDHGMGVVIGETTEIGDNCLIYQGVTLGGTGKDRGKRHPTLGNNVKIAANAVVLEAIPDNCTAVGVPARIARCNGKPTTDLDQVHIPDPVAQELCKMDVRLSQLEKKAGITPAPKDEPNLDCGCGFRSDDYDDYVI